jgi:hypothetical protein
MTPALHASVHIQILIQERKSMDELLKNIAGAPQVEFINTPEGFTEAAERSLECTEKVIYYLGRAEILMDAYEQAYEDGHYIPTRIKLGVLVKMLVEDTPMMQRYRDTDEEQVRETRCLPPGADFKHSFMVHDDTVVFFMKTDSGATGLSIVNAEIAETMKTVFHEIWQRGI